MDNIRSRRQVVAVVSQVAILSVSVQGTCWGTWHVNIRHLDPLPLLPWSLCFKKLWASWSQVSASWHGHQGWAWHWAGMAVTICGPSHTTCFWNSSPNSLISSDMFYTLQTRHRKQVSDKITFSKYFYVSGMLCGKWGFDKSGNCVRVPTLVGSVSSDFLFDNNRLQSLSVFAPHLNYSLHKNISQNTQSIRNQHK